jgi:cobalamin biosynthesis protein CobT
MTWIERFGAASIECQVVPNGVAMYPPADLAAGVPEADIVAALGTRVNEPASTRFYTTASWFGQQGVSRWWKQGWGPGKLASQRGG